MVRVFLFAFVPFILPALGYVLWKLVRQKRSQAKVSDIDWAEGPWLWLCGGGLALLIATLIALSQFESGKPGDQYYPPKLIDGKIVPGRIVPKSP